MVQVDGSLGAAGTPHRRRSAQSAGLAFATPGRAFAVDRVARPHDVDAGAARRRIDDADCTARLFEQRLRDEEAKTHAFVLLERSRWSDLGFAECIVPRAR